jgi:hypothetical protein
MRGKKDRQPNMFYALDVEDRIGRIIPCGPSRNWSTKTWLAWGICLTGRMRIRAGPACPRSGVRQDGKGPGFRRSLWWYFCDLLAANSRALLRQIRADRMETAYAGLVVYRDE